MVWAAGFEPATSRFRAGDSDLTELRPEVSGRGSVSIVAALLVLGLPRLPLLGSEEHLSLDGWSAGLPVMASSGDAGTRKIREASGDVKGSCPFWGGACPI